MKIPKMKKIGKGKQNMGLTPILSKRRRYMVAVSGGADSMALLHLMMEHGFRRLVVCHLDHRLRGRASTEDARFVDRVARKLGLAVEAGRIDVAKRARETGESIEVAARQARHEFFAECAVRHRCNRVVLAHHADDQAETVIWNLLRGSHGTKGMSQIQTISVGRRRLELYRPLLERRRAELREFLRFRKIRWREDATNALPHTPRNRLRHEALPLLGEIAGRDVVPVLVRSAHAEADAEAILDWALGQTRVLDPQGRLHLPVLRSLPLALQQAAIHRYLADHGVPDLDRATVLRCLALTDPSAPPAIVISGARRFRRRAGRMWVEP